MSENLSCESCFTIQYRLGKKIKVTISNDTYTTRFFFIDKKFVEIIGKKLEI